MSVPSWRLGLSSSRQRTCSLNRTSEVSGAGSTEGGGRENSVKGKRGRHVPVKRFKNTLSPAHAACCALAGGSPTVSTLSSRNTSKL